MTEFSQGVEKVVRVDTAEGEKRRRIDAYYGNAVIEFENSLKVTGKEAERQLREYTSGLRAKEGTNRRHIVAIASDGILWKVYRTRLREDFSGKPKPADIILELTQEFSLSEKNLDFFWMWLTTLLFRPNSIEATSEHFRVDFGDTSQAYHDCLQVMRKVWPSLKKESEPNLAFQTWKKYLAVTYGSLEKIEGYLDELFLKHTYLSSLARLLIWASLSKGKSSGSLRNVAKEVLSGEYFQARNLANLVEDDFFQWVRHESAENALAPVWERTIAQLQTYDLDHLREDLFKGIYQDLIQPTDRHELGEYYTPDWLCERMVDEMLPASGYVSVLDPTCGSGSFMRATIDHFKKANPKGSAKAQLDAILEHVVGIDIHPLAATISRATYVLALGDLVNSAKRAITIPVYLADALFLPTEVRQHTIGQKPMYGVKFGDKEVSMPEALVKSSELFDISISACSRVAIDHAKEMKETPQRLSRFLDQETDLLKGREDREEIIVSLWEFTEELAALIRKREDSIWAFIVRNSYKPSMLKGKFDIILGNPPWLSYRYVKDPNYQAEIKKRAIKDYGIAPDQQKLFTQMELATVILAHSIEWFGGPGARLGFVMPRSILSADQHTKLRTRKYNASFRLVSYWDLLDVEPLFSVPSCVLFIRKDSDRGDVSDRLPAVEWHGKLPARDVPWKIAKMNLTTAAKQARVIYLGSRDALSTLGGKSTVGLSGPYNKDFRQGASILPRSFYFVSIKDLSGKPDPNRVYWAETDSEQAEEAKKPWDTVRISGKVEGRFIYCSVLAKQLMPFTLIEPAAIVVPVEENGGKLSVYTSEELRDKGSREFAQWMRKVEDEWNEKREDKAEKQNVYQRLDYQKELTEQNLNDRHLVLYSTSGTNLAAAYVDREKLTLRLLLDHKTYWASFPSENEAHYLAAILNSETVNEAIKPFQSMGLMGERDIHKKVLDVPFPSYDKDNSTHRDLVQFAKDSAKAANKATRLPGFPGHISGQRAFIRVQLEKIRAEMDRLVKSII